MGDLSKLAEQIREHPEQMDALLEEFLSSHHAPQHTLAAVVGQLDRLSRLVVAACEDIPPQFEAQMIRTRNALHQAQMATINLLNTING